MDKVAGWIWRESQRADLSQCLRPDADCGVLRSSCAHVLVSWIRRTFLGESFRSHRRSSGVVHVAARAGGNRRSRQLHHANRDCRPRATEHRPRHRMVPHSEIAQRSSGCNCCGQARRPDWYGGRLSIRVHGKQHIVHRIIYALGSEPLLRFRRPAFLSHSFLRQRFWRFCELECPCNEAVEKYRSAAGLQRLGFPV